MRKKCSLVESILWIEAYKLVNRILIIDQLLIFHFFLYIVHNIVTFWPCRLLHLSLHIHVSTKTSLWQHTPGPSVRMTSLCCSYRWKHIHGHEGELSSLRVTCDVHHGRVLCWHSRQSHTHKEPFICPCMFKPRSRHAARCPSGLDNKPASICACMNDNVCVHMPCPPPPPPQCYDPQPWMGPDSLRGRRVSLWKVLNQQGAQQSTAVCACVCVCGFQGCCCQLALLRSTALCLGSSLSLSGPLCLSSISVRQKEQKASTTQHNYAGCVCVCRVSPPTPKHSKQLSYDQWVSHYSDL